MGAPLGHRQQRGRRTGLVGMLVVLVALVLGASAPVASATATTTGRPVSARKFTQPDEVVRPAVSTGSRAHERRPMATDSRLPQVVHRSTNCWIAITTEATALTTDRVSWHSSGRAPPR